MTDLLNRWQQYLNEIHNWQDFIINVIPKHNGCGIIYELENPFKLSTESFAIADMRNIKFAQPHYHPEVEIYFVLQGFGIIVIGGEEQSIQQNSVSVIPSNIAHFTIPINDLVIAVVNTPPFKAENYFALKDDKPEVKFSKVQFLEFCKEENTVS